MKVTYGRRGAMNAENTAAATSRIAARPTNHHVTSRFPGSRPTTEPRFS